MKEDSITEYHCCNDCEHKCIVPVSIHQDRWELACLKNRKEVNREGGLTNCPVWKDEDMIV